MKKIIIFYGSYGGGHLSAANSMKEYINEKYPYINIQLIDCVQYFNKAFNKISTTAYNEMAKKAPWAWGKIYAKSQKGALAYFTTESNKIMALKLKKLIKEEQPDLIISTHPFSSQMCAYLKRKKAIDVKLATIMTDFAPHEQWLVFHEFCDYFFVAHEEMKQMLVNKGIDENKVYATGIPISKRFSGKYDEDEIVEQFGLEKDKKTILFFAGGKFGLGKSNTYEILKVLAEDYPDFQIIAISGKNEKMRHEFEDIVFETMTQNRIKVLEFTDMVPELMEISDVVITKPGGLTTTESLASGLPLIMINPIPGQEEENAEYLEKSGVGIWLKKEDNIEEKLKEILADQNKLDDMKNNAKKLGKVTSTKDICDILFNIQ